MKTETNKKELKKLNACSSGYKVFVAAHGDKNAKLSECLISNGWDDLWWLISNTYEHFTAEQKNDLREYGCRKALLNIEKIKPYCSDSDYNLIVTYLNNPTYSAVYSARSAAYSAARSAARSAADSARSAAYSAADSAHSAAYSAAYSAARSAADSAAYSAARSAARSAVHSAAEQQNKDDLMEVLLKWESEK